MRSKFIERDSFSSIIRFFPGKNVLSLIKPH